MKYEKWQYGAGCPTCNKPVNEHMGEVRTHAGPCCPHCGHVVAYEKSVGGFVWPRAVFRRVKDGWFSPWRWQKWQEPVVSGVEVRFTMEQPEEGSGT